MAENKEGRGRKSKKNLRKSLKSKVTPYVTGE
jgi:hypothetical protein